MLSIIIKKSLIISAPLPNSLPNSIAKGNIRIYIRDYSLPFEPSQDSWMFPERKKNNVVLCFSLLFDYKLKTSLEDATSLDPKFTVPYNTSASCFLLLLINVLF